MIKSFTMNVSQKRQFHSQWIYLALSQLLLLHNSLKYEAIENTICKAWYLCFSKQITQGSPVVFVHYLPIINSKFGARGLMKQESWPMRSPLIICLLKNIRSFNRQSKISNAKVWLQGKSSAVVNKPMLRYFQYSKSNIQPF